MESNARRQRLTIPAIAAILYFSQGFPYGVFVETLNLYLSVQRVPLATIGLLSSLGVIWTLKVFWAPLVDAVGTYRQWILGALIVLAVAFGAFSFAAPAGSVFWVAAAVLVAASATQDIAIDALTIRITPRDLLGPVNSARVTAYRVAVIAAGGGIAVLADRAGWPAAFASIAAVPLVIASVLAMTIPPGAGGTERHENPLRALWGWIARPGAIPLLAVVLLYRLGDSAMRPMIKPFWVARGFSATEIANVTTTLGMVCTIAGAIAGGAFVARFGVYRGLLGLGMLQMASNLVYAFVAAAAAGRPAMYGAAMTETFCDGLGTGAFLSFLMAICDKENAATEYAMLSAVFGLSRTLAGAFSGYLAEDLGFALYFAATAVVALPGLALVPVVRRRLTG
jgi:PAT family beta-lactamase induction signal transducer AmpG